MHAGELGKWVSKVSRLGKVRKMSTAKPGKSYNGPVSCLHISSPLSAALYIFSISVIIEVDIFWGISIYIYSILIG